MVPTPVTSVLCSATFGEEITVVLEGKLLASAGPRQLCGFQPTGVFSECPNPTFLLHYQKQELNLVIGVELNMPSNI